MSLVYSPTIHAPTTTAPTVSGKVAVCAVCGTQWQLQSTQPPYDDARGCSFCDAPQDAITIVNETE